MYKLEELLKKSQEMVEALNKAIVTDVHSTIAYAKTDAKKAIEEFNEAAKNDAYEIFLASEKPFYAALRDIYYPCKALKVKIDKETKREVAEIEDTEEVVNLAELEDLAKKRVSVNGQWRYWVEKFTQLMSARVISDVGTDADKKRFKGHYKINKAAESCDIGSAPTSMNSTIKALQKIVDGIIFDDNGEGLNSFKITSKDVKYIEYLMCGKGKTRYSISVPRNTTMLKLITVALSRIVLNADYAVEFDTVKKK